MGVEKICSSRRGVPSAVVPSSKMPRDCSSGTGWPWPGRRSVQHLAVARRWGGGQWHQPSPACPPFQQVVADQRDVLDAFAVELHQKFFDLAAALLGLFVQRDADLAVRRRHGLGRQTRVFALDVEVADLAEVEQLLVEVGPKPMPAAVRCA